MESALNGLSQMTVLVIVAAVGYLAGKLGYLDSYTNQKMTKLLLNITLPCMVVASVHGLSAEDAGAVVGPAFAMSAAQFFLLLAAGVLLAGVLRVRKRDRPIYVFMTVCTNTGFIGLPVVAAILGDASVIISSIYIMVIAFFLYSIGFAVLARAEAQQAAGHSGAAGDASEDATAGAGMKPKISIPWRSMVNPSMIACVIALVLFFTGWQVPGLVQESLSLIGGITAPIAMLVVGVIVANTRIGEVVKEVRLYPYILVRQLLLPAAFYAGFVALGVSSLLAGVFALMFAMPVGSMCPTFVAQFRGNAQLAAKATALTTIGSFIVIPLLVVFMGFVG